MIKYLSKAKNFKTQMDVRERNSSKENCFEYYGIKPRRSYVNIT